MSSLPRPAPPGNPGGENRARALPFDKVPRDLRTHPELSDGAFRVYAALVWLDGLPRGCIASNEQIGQAAGGKDARTVRRALRELEGYGQIRPVYADPATRRNRIKIELTGRPMPAVEGQICPSLRVVAPGGGSNLSYHDGGGGTGMSLEGGTKMSTDLKLSELENVNVVDGSGVEDEGTTPVRLQADSPDLPPPAGGGGCRHGEGHEDGRDAGHPLLEEAGSGGGPGRPSSNTPPAPPAPTRGRDDDEDDPREATGSTGTPARSMIAQGPPPAPFAREDLARLPGRPELARGAARLIARELEDERSVYFYMKKCREVIECREPVDRLVHAFEEARKSSWAARRGAAFNRAWNDWRPPDTDEDRFIKTNWSWIVSAVRTGTATHISNGMPAEELRHRTARAADTYAATRGYRPDQASYLRVGYMRALEELIVQGERSVAVQGVEEVADRDVAVSEADLEVEKAYAALTDEERARGEEAIRRLGLRGVVRDVAAGSSARGPRPALAMP